MRRSRVDRLARLLVASAFMVGVVAAGDLALPSATVACSCVPQQPLAEYAKEPNNIIVAGTIGPVVNQEAILAVERLFKGNLANANLRIRGGDGAMCGVTLMAGARVLMVAFMDGGVALPSSCAPFADLSTPDGQRLLGEAQTVFGDTGGPGPDPPTEPPATPVDGDGNADLALGAILAVVVGSTVVLFGLLALVTRRRPAPPE